MYACYLRHNVKLKDTIKSLTFILVIDFDRTSDVNYLQRKMEILLEPNINKIMVDPHRFEGNLKMVVNGNLFPADSQRSIATMLLPGPTN
ncbi:hypothetical protein Tco_1378782 [Tanacetum coccineum]